MTPPTICQYALGQINTENARYVILSEHRESKDLGTISTRNITKVRKFFDFAALRSE